MSLSCACDYDGEGWSYLGPDGYTVFDLKRRKRCCSCRQLIEHNAIAVRFERLRSPVTDIEEKICGTDVYLADWWMCERCGDLYFSLEELGYCVAIGDQSMLELVAEYADEHRRRT